MKSFITLLIVISLGYQPLQAQDKITVSIYDNSGVMINQNEPLDLNNLPKYLLFVPDDSSLKIMKSELTLVSDGIGRDTITGSKIIKLNEGLVEKFEDGDFLVIKINFENLKEHYTTLKVKG